MLSKLRIQNAWVHKDLTIDFKEGLTAIVGKNGRGKSLITEMIQYAFWGTKALRGTADDYKKVIVELWFSLKGKNYYIKRSNTTVLLTEIVGDDKQLALATGTTPVNAAVIRLFGYGYDVFQVSNAANQGAVALLSRMKPTERKAMVDKTVGLQVIDVLEKFIGESLKTVTDTLAAKREGHFEPQKPTKPQDYKPLAEVDQRLTGKRQQLRTLEILQAQANAQIEKPLPPTLVELPHKIDTLRELQQAYAVDEAERLSARKSLDGLPAPREPAALHARDAEYDTLNEQLAEAQAREREKTTLARLIGDTPRESEHTREELREQGDAMAMARRWDERETLRKALHLNHCPKCDHEWHTPNPKLDAYTDVPEERPTYTMSQAVVATKMKLLDDIDQAKKHYEALDKLMTEHRDNLEKERELYALVKEISAARQAHALYLAAKGYDDMRAESTTRLAREGLKSWAVEIAQAERNDKAEASYKQALAAAKAAQEKADIAKSAVETFPLDLAEQVAALDMQVRSVLVYDQQVSAYNTALAAFKQRDEEINALENDSEAWRLSRAAMADVRATVKGYLIPSLNKVGTNLLAQMTGGELGGLHVDEDFNIMADGKRVEVLSGAGADVANLALRLSLGTVLTNNTFSVLMLDEIDSGYDDDRAEYTQKALMNLTKTFKQVLIISHKSTITSDHRVEL